MTPAEILKRVERNEFGHFTTSIETVRALVEYVRAQAQEEYKAAVAAQLGYDMRAVITGTPEQVHSERVRAQAVASERERCARVAVGNGDWLDAGEHIAERIRKGK